MLEKSGKPRIRFTTVDVDKWVYGGRGRWVRYRYICAGGGISASGKTINGAYKNWWSLYLESDNCRQPPHAVEGLPLDWRGSEEE